MKKLIFLSIALGAMIFAGCTGTPCCDGASIIVTPSELVFNADGTPNVPGVDFFTITSPTPYNFAPAEGWISPTGSGIITVAVSPWPSFDDRQGRIILTAASGEKVTVIIRQLGIAPEEIDPANAGWTLDRMDPAGWISGTFFGNNDVLQITVDDSAPGTNSSTNNQGKNFAVNNPTQSENWIVEADIYITADMADPTSNDPFHVSFWAHTYDYTLAVYTGYPIIAASNVIDSPGDELWNYTPGDMTPYFYLYDYVGNWTQGPALTEGWHNLRMESDASVDPVEINYYIDNTLVGTYVLDPGEAASLRHVHVSAYNFTTLYTTTPQPYAGYTFDGYFANIKSYVW